MVCIKIADTGGGIPKENLSQMFAPFFTTKPAGEGTGLGLSVSYGIIESHHGRIEVDSQEGEGSNFYIWLPEKKVEKGAVGLG
jgi:signal transduction histidine kinase